MTRARIRFLVLSAVLAIGLSACAGDDRVIPPVATTPVGVPLAPMAMPRLSTGDVWVYRDAGRDRLETERVESVDGALVTLSSDATGCRWTRTAMMVDPSIAWDGCEGTTGFADLTGTDTTTLYPLEIGKSASWTIDGRVTLGVTFKRTRTCRVEDTVSVSVPAGTFDTFHVYCEQGTRLTDFYIAPDLGTTVLWRQTRKHSGRVRQRELVSLERSTGPVEQSTP